MKIGIIGNGHWGNALAALAKRAGHSVAIDDFLGATPDGFADADLWLAVVPSTYFRSVMRVAGQLYGGQTIIICTKGMDSGQLMSEVLAEELPKSDGLVGALSGPQFANEVAEGLPTGSGLAGPARVRETGRAVFGEFYLEETDDLRGAEFCGVGKNAAALVAGYYSVAGAGENERAMMLSRAWSEVVDLGVALGADLRTFAGLCGTGDLFLSATSKTSRNFSAGTLIARGEPIAGTIEGIAALRGLRARAAAAGIKTPVLDFVAEKILQSD
jgi:glycerol-3-phosphate dehydrogenase (NAD(P)+)